MTRAQVLLPCDDLDETLDYYTTELGFRVEQIWPADDPSVAVLVGHGARLRLDREHGGEPGRLILEVDRPVPPERVAPNGTVVQFVDANPPLTMPPLAQKRTVSRNNDGDWGVGRAGMRYRDLIPDREGGRFIASHIHIPTGGPVPDYVHFHQIRFQMIFVRSGWVKVVYEDQGDPFVMHAGDCVLQPPLIRHRVLESSDDLEVIEIGSPAEHRTAADHQIELPTPTIESLRDFEGQTFVRHVAADAEWKPSRWAGFEAANTGIDQATTGLAEVQVLRSLPGGEAAGSGGEPRRSDHEFQFFFVLNGSAAVELGDATIELGPGDCITLPTSEQIGLVAVDVEILDVRIP